MSVRKAFMSLPLGASGFTPASLNPLVYQFGGATVLEAIGPDDPAEDADKVRRHLDSSGNGFYKENPTVSIQPAFRATGVNSQPSIDYNRAGSEGLFFVSAANPVVAGAAGVADLARNKAAFYCAFVVDFDAIESSPGTQILFHAATATADSRFTPFINGNNRVDFFTRRLDADTGDSLSLMNPSLANKPTIIICHINYATGFKTLRAINDTIDVTVTNTASHGTGNSEDTASSQISFGSVSGGAASYDGDETELFLKDSILSTPDEALLVNFWKTLYGI